MTVQLVIRFQPLLQRFSGFVRQRGLLPLLPGIQLQVGDVLVRPAERILQQHHRLFELVCNEYKVKILFDLLDLLADLGRVVEVVGVQPKVEEHLVSPDVLHQAAVPEPSRLVRQGVGLQGHVVVFPEVHIVPQRREELDWVSQNGEVEPAAPGIPARLPVHDGADGGRVPDAVQAVHVVGEPCPLPRCVGDHGRVEGDLLAEVVACEGQDNIEVVLVGVAEEHVLQGAAGALVGLQEDRLALGLASLVPASARAARRTVKLVIL